LKKSTWFSFLKAGLARQVQRDKLAGDSSAQGTRADLENLQPFLKRHWRKGILGAILILFSSLLVFPAPLINRFLVDEVMLAKRLDLLPLAILMIGGVKLVSMGADTFQKFYFTRFEQAITLDIQQNLLDHTLRLPKAFFDNKEVGYLISRLSSDVQGLRWIFSSNIIYILTSVIKFIGGVIFLFFLEWRLGIVTLVVLPVLVLSARYFSERMRALSQHGMERNAGVLQRFEETLVSIPLLKAFTSERRESQRVMAAVSASQQIEMEQATVGTIANLVLSIVPDLARAVVLVAGAYKVIVGQWTLGSLLAFQSYLGYVYGPALSLAFANLQLQNALTSLRRVSTILSIIPEDNDGAGLVVDHLQGDLRFEKVSFSYNGQEQVLQEASFHIQPGERIIIAGPSGVGKTTLVSLLLRFYQPTHGQIKFDDRIASEYELRSLRQRIGYVSQTTLLLAGTIRENLCYGNEDASPAEIEGAANAAGIHDFILGLPDGYDSRIDERSVNLSEGQKQRLSIARALIKSPDILILDEPTSALDSLVERSILEALPDRAYGKTTFIISHRPSTIQQADRILLLTETGSLQMGTHTELLDASPYYRSLFQHAES
jgi:ABC-type multidrug transport system fused ATPase/permease subunit